MVSDGGFRLSGNTEHQTHDPQTLIQLLSNLHHLHLLKPRIEHYSYLVAL